MFITGSENINSCGVDAAVTDNIGELGNILFNPVESSCEKVTQIMESGFDKYFVDHTTGVYPIAASSLPWRAEYIQAKGDILADLHEDLAAEQKARVTYDNLLRLIDDPDVREPLKFLRQREIVHYQRFGEALRLTADKLDSKNFYACNPSFDKNCGK